MTSSLLLGVLLGLTVAGAQDIDKYYGIPVGGVHLSSDATSGELYAFDEYTIFFNHLMHIPKNVGCTTMMVGPPRAQDQGASVVRGHGVILPLSQLLEPPPDDQPPVPVVFEREARRRRRLRRAARPHWPLRMDHLILGEAAAAAAAANGTSARRGSFDGIRISRLERNGTLPERAVSIAGAPAEERRRAPSAAPKAHQMPGAERVVVVSQADSFTDQRETTPAPASASPSTAAPASASPSTTDPTSASPSTTDPTSASPSTTASAAPSTSPSTSPSTQPPTTTTATPPPTSSQPQPAPTDPTTPPTPEPTRPSTTVRPAPTTSSVAPHISTEKPQRSTGPQVVVKAHVNPANAARPSRLQSLSRKSDGQQPSQPAFVQPGPSLPEPQPQPKPAKPTGVFAQSDFEDVFPDEMDIQQSARSGGEYKLDVNYGDLLEKLGGGGGGFRRAPSRTAANADSKGAAAATGGHGWRVVEDPHRAHRERVLRLLLAEEGGVAADAEPGDDQFQAQPIEFLDKSVALPEIRMKQAFFRLQNGARLTDYHWFGLYNHCEKRHLRLVNLRNVDPPHEERIMPFSGWANGVSSYRLHILNCNTILVPGFTFDPAPDARSTFIVAGIGEFPDKVEKQIKVIVVGEPPNQPLRKFDNEDVLLRLPHTYRTFDVDFLSVFNTQSQKSLGHVTIPSLLVPPCQEE